MQFHVHPSEILTPESIPEGISQITTLLSGETIKAVKRVDDDDSGEFRIVLFANDDAAIKFYNLTFAGVYRDGTDTYIVHAING